MEANRTDFRQSPQHRMNPKTIIYLHGFNSASLDLNGNLLTGKEKLLVMRDFCTKNNIVFDTQNHDYRDFQTVVEGLLFKWNQHLELGREVFFMGSSLGGFACKYMAMKTACKAVMINPSINPSESLTRFIGVTENFETREPYHWERSHCEQYRKFEQELANFKQPLDLTLLLDMGDELLNPQLTLSQYQSVAKVVTFPGGSHGFEHMKEALPTIEQVIFGSN